MEGRTTLFVVQSLATYSQDLKLGGESKISACGIFQDFFECLLLSFFSEGS